VFYGNGVKNPRRMLVPSPLANAGFGFPTPLLWATYMPDLPEKQPELIAAVRVGSVISLECSVCHKTIMVKGIHVGTQAELKHILKEAFAEHLGEEHRPDSRL
jgi:hypothetical protein